MRAKIKARFALVTPLEFLAPQGNVVVQDKSRFEFAWRWHDGERYLLRYPRYGFRHERVWCLESATRSYSGQIVIPADSTAGVRAKFPAMQWRGADETFVQQMGPGIGQIRQSDSKRIAVWKPNCFGIGGLAEVVYASASLAPVLLGFVLAAVFDPSD